MNTLWVHFAKFAGVGVWRLQLLETASLTKTVDRSLSGIDVMPTDLTVVRWCQATLVLGLLMLATAPLFVADTYSIVTQTLSESGGQGVDGAWVFRTGVLITSLAVSVLSTRAEPLWGRQGAFWLRMYALGLVFLAVFPESPWYGDDYNAAVAGLHTVSGVLAAAAFILGVAAVSSRRNGPLRTKIFDWLAMATVGLIPQIMLLVDFGGLLQRSMVLLGYVWLISQSTRVARHLRSSPTRHRTAVGASSTRPPRVGASL